MKNQVLMFKLVVNKNHVHFPWQQGLDGCFPTTFSDAFNLFIYKNYLDKSPLDSARIVKRWGGGWPRNFISWAYI